DETRWRVFVLHAGKAGFVWYLWVFVSKESIVFVLDPTRAHDVPEAHFGDDAEGIANVDRYSAYKAMAQVKAAQITLAFCCAHVQQRSRTPATRPGRGAEELLRFGRAVERTLGGHVVLAVPNAPAVGHGHRQMADGVLLGLCAGRGSTTAARPAPLPAVEHDA